MENTPSSNEQPIPTMTIDPQYDICNAEKLDPGEFSSESFQLSDEENAEQEPREELNHCHLISRTFHPGHIRGEVTREEMAKNFVSKFDIFLREVLVDVGGNLESTKFNLQATYPECVGNFLYIRYKTYPHVNLENLQRRVHNKVVPNMISSNHKFSILKEVFVRKDCIVPYRPDEAVTKNPEAFMNYLMFNCFGPKNFRVSGNSHSLPISLAMGVLFTEFEIATDETIKKKLGKKIEKLTNPKRTLESRTRGQLRLGKRLLREAGMDEDFENFNYLHLVQLACHMSSYQIYLWEINKPHRVPMQTVCFNETADKFIGLFHRDSHYECVTHINRWGRLRFCYICSVLGYESKHFNCRETPCDHYPFPESARFLKKKYRRLQ